MIKGLYAAATGMIALEARQSILANNIANSSTPGFRKQEPIMKGFYDVYLDKLGTVAQYNNRIAPGGGVEVDQTYTLTRNGPITSTGDSLNVGLQGPGYLVVDTPRGERYTRNGTFAIDADGELATVDGLKVQGAGGGGIDVSGGKIQFEQDGTVLVDGKTRGKLRVVEFKDPHKLYQQGENLYAARPEAKKEMAEGVNTRVIGKTLEQSNVQVPIALTNMMIGLRAYAANQRVINAINETMGRVIDQVGSPT